MKQRPIADLRPPYHYYFSQPHVGPRRVYARIGSFTGYGTHFHVTLREEPNPIRDPEDGAWVIAVGDTESEGRERFMKFRRRETAERWARTTFEEEFNSHTHELVFVDESHRWYYEEGA